MASIGRYDRTRGVVTQLDKFRDLLGWIEGLRSKSYLTDLIAEHHAAPITDTPKRLAALIAPLIETAISYVEQSEGGPAVVSFLPLYYAMLNLAKVYILLGPLGASLEDSRNRRHGVEYDPAWEDQLRLDRQKVRLHPAGVMGLFYKTLTREPWVTSRSWLTMAQVYPYIPQVAHEYSVATGGQHGVVPATITSEPMGEDWHLVCTIEDENFEYQRGLNHVGALRNGHWEYREAGNKRYISSHSRGSREAWRELANCCLERSLIYHGPSHPLGADPQGMVYLPVSRAIFPRMPEEFPIIVAFFYQSSVARYKPEFLMKQMDSKYWPLLVTLRRHAAFSFFLAFWNFMTQESLYISTA